MPLSTYIALRTFDKFKAGDELRLTDKQAADLNRNKATVIRKPAKKQAKPKIKSKEEKFPNKETK